MSSKQLIDASKETVLLKVELFVAKKGSGAPGPKPKRPWLSIAVDPASLTHPELIRSVNQTLDSLGFSKLKQLRRSLINSKSNSTYFTQNIMSIVTLRATLPT